MRGGSYSWLPPVCLLGVDGLGATIRKGAGKMARKDAGTTGRRSLDRVERYTTLIGPGSRFVGQFSGVDDYVIEGEVKGECDILGVLLVARSGRFEGEVRGSVVVVAGTVEGDLVVREKLELRPSGRVKGNILSPIIAIATGAVHDGEIRMLDRTQVTEFEDRRKS